MELIRKYYGMYHLDVPVSILGAFTWFLLHLSGDEDNK